MQHQPLAPDQLRRVCSPEELDGQSSEHIQPLETIIGQKRAVKALKFGLGNKNPGFNVYVSGEPGTGRMTIVRQFLEQLAEKEPIPLDWCYVYNFEDPYCPRQMSLPAGRVRQFRTDMQVLVQELQEALAHVFESDDFAERKEEILSQVNQQKNDQLEGVRRRAQQEGFNINFTPVGPVAVPLIEGRPMTEDEFQNTSEEARQGMMERQKVLEKDLQGLAKKFRGLDKEANKQLQQLEKDAALYATEVLFEEIEEAYQEILDVVDYLKEVRQDILSDLVAFVKPEGEPGQAMPMVGGPAPIVNKYEVNVLVENGDKKGAPLIMEFNPTYNNVFGKVEKESYMGALTTDFSLIRSGSLHRANGGYLVIPMIELLRNPYSWDGLKRALRNGEIVIEELGERLGYITTKTLKPAPIPLNIQVVLIGDDNLYRLLYLHDKDFRDLFKVKAEFDLTIQRDTAHIHSFVALLSKICQDEDLLPFDVSAQVMLVEHASRMAGHQGKLSVEFGVISDIIRESGYYARQEEQTHVQGKHVEKTIEERYYRSNLLQDKIQELMDEGIITIDVEGEKPGQINGLAVLNAGDFRFGRPSKITATVSVGKKGVINIDREAKLSGPTHTKGVMILNGFFMHVFGQKRIISFNASLVFEQSYGMIDGDSASSTELYAILSSLSGCPIKQGIAVTGSVNQWGDVQAIGGVNEKIEGFFEVCRRSGEMTGAQGVMIPASNTQNLMLKREIVDAVEQGLFHIWPVTSISQGIEILTGQSAGERDEKGQYPEDSIFGKVEKRLEELTRIVMNNGKKQKEEKSD